MPVIDAPSISEKQKSLAGDYKHEDLQKVFKYLDINKFKDLSEIGLSKSSKQIIFRLDDNVFIRILSTKEESKLEEVDKKKTAAYEKMKEKENPNELDDIIGSDEKPLKSPYETAQQYHTEERVQLSSEEWLNQCRETYQRELPRLQKKYPGEFVAVMGKRIVEINKLSVLDNKYLHEGSPAVKIFYIPDNEIDTSKSDLTLSTPLFD